MNEASPPVDQAAKRGDEAAAGEETTAGGVCEREWEICDGPVGPEPPPDAEPAAEEPVPVAGPVGQPGLVAGKVVSWPVVPGEPRLVALLDGYQRTIGRGAIFLAYDQPVEPARLAPLVRLSVEGEPLPVEVFRPASIERVYEGEVDVAFLLAVRARDLPEDGSRVTLEVPSRQGGDEPAAEAIVLTVRTDFRHLETAIESMSGRTRSGDRVPLDARLRLSFSGPVGVAEARKQIRIEPAPARVNVWTYGHQVEIAAELAPGARYTLTVPASLRDTLGNRLGRARREKLRAVDLTPVAELPGGPLLLERRRARIPIKTTNVAAPSLVVSRFSGVADFVRAAEARKPARCAGLGGMEPGGPALSGPRGGPLNQPRAGTIDLTAGPGRELRLDERGLLACAELSAEGRGSERKEGEPVSSAALLQLTDLGLTAKVHAGGFVAWVSSLSKAEPVAGAAVSLLDPKGKVLARAETDARGLANLPSEGLSRRGGVEGRVYLAVEHRGDAAVTAISDRLLSQPWQFGLAGETAGPEPLIASVFTERGVYRPEEAVRIAAVVRERGQDGSLTVPEKRKLGLQVIDARGSELASQAVEIDRFGTADATVELPAGAAIGRYRVRVESGDRSAQTTFRVAEYRVPTFEVEVSAEAEGWERGEARALVEARYLSGGALAGREVEYSVSRVPASLEATGLSGFVYRAVDADVPAGRIAEGKARLDGEGRARLDFRPSHPPAAGPMRYVVDASVTDVDRQAYAGRLARTVHPTDRYIGVRPPTRGVLAAGEVLEVPVVAVTPEGSPVPGVAVTVRLEEIEYHTTARVAGGGARRSSREVAREKKRCRVVTRDRPQSCRLAVRRAGHYRVVAEARDGERRRIATGFPVTFGGGRPIAWPRFDHERIEVLSDRRRYRPGETARLMVKSPFSRARGLLTLERQGVLEQRVFEIEGDSPILEVPIGEAHAPGLYASVVLLRGRVHEEEDATGFETGAPAFRIGYASLEVEPREARLEVTVNPEAVVQRPGRPLDIDLAVRDLSGRPVSGRAVVMVVDEAVLGMTGYATPDPIEGLYARAPLGVRTASSYLDLPHSRRARREAIFPGGGGGDGFGLEEIAPEVRDVFASTAFFDPRVALGADGRARVRVELPDNLTAFRIMAIAVDEGARAGAGEARVVVRKPVMVRAAASRFAYPGDRLQIEAVVENGTAEEATARVTARLEGFEAGAELARRGSVPAGGQATFSFPVEVTGRERGRVRLMARLGAYTDVVEVEVPLLDPGSRRRAVASARVTGEGKLAVDLPPERLPGSGRLELLVSTTRLSELRGAVDYLLGYPNGCIEQTTSRAYPLVVLEDLLPDIGVDIDRAKLSEYAEAGVKRLLGFQTSSGGLAYWPGSDDPHAFGTAFGLTALLEARSRGYDVPERALGRMASYLESSLRAGEITESMPHGGMADADTRALFVMTLGRLGRPQPGYVSTLWQERDKLSPFGLSLLAVAVSEGAGEGALLEAILAEIRTRAVEESEEAYFEGDPDGGYSMGSPLRTHAGALLAFARTRPESPVSGKLLAGLLARQQYGLWGNTQENVFGVMGVAAAVAKEKEGEGPDAILKVGGRPLDLAGAKKVSGRLRKLSLREDELRLAGGGKAVVDVRSKSAMPLFVTARAEWDEPLTDETMAPVAKGFRVTRRYETLAGEPIDGPVPLGSLLVVRIGVESDEARNYVAAVDRLPAGLEALSAELATTQSVVREVGSKAEARGLAALSYSEIRDSRVGFYADALPAGSYEFTYVARATTPGTFLRPAAGAEAMYQPDVHGASRADRIVIE